MTVQTILVIIFQRFESCNYYFRFVYGIRNLIIFFYIYDLNYIKWTFYYQYFSFLQNKPLIFIFNTYKQTKPKLSFSFHCLTTRSKVIECISLPKRNYFLKALLLFLEYLPEAIKEGKQTILRFARNVGILSWWVMDGGFEIDVPFPSTYRYIR